jgi:hypothetical protein
MANLPTSAVIVPADPNVEGPNSGMNGGASDSALGICTDNPNPKETDWARIVIGATINPIGNPDNPQVGQYQSLAEYEIDTFDASPVGFAPADTEAGPGEIYATNAGDSGWDLTNKTVEYTTVVGDWLWGAVSGTGPQPTCKVYECDSFQNALAAEFKLLWLMDDNPVGSTITDINLGAVVNLGPDVGEMASIMQDVCVAEGGSLIGGTQDSSGSLPDMSQYTSTLFGSFAALFDPAGIESINAINQIYAATLGSGLVVGLTLTGNDVSVRTKWNSIQDTTTFPNVVAATGSYVILNWTIDESDPNLTNVAWELFVDFVSVGTGSQTTTNTPLLITGATEFYLWRGGVGEARMQYLTFNDLQITAEQMQILSDAWDQNEVGYIDPNPNCIPP